MCLKTYLKVYLKVFTLTGCILLIKSFTVTNDNSYYSNELASVVNFEANDSILYTATGDDRKRLLHNFRCDTNNTHSTYKVFKNYRKYSHKVIRYRFENFSPYIDECTTRNIFKISFRLWEFSANVKFLEAKKKGRVDMRIQFFKGEHGDGWDFDGPGNILAHTFNGGDMHLDLEEWWIPRSYPHFPWTEAGNSHGSACVFPFIYKGVKYTSCIDHDQPYRQFWCATTSNYDVDFKFGYCPSNSTDLLWTAVHETGHALGLNHSDNCLAIMYAEYGYREKFGLELPDIEGARLLYGPQKSQLDNLKLEKCNITKGKITIEAPITTTLPPTTVATTTSLEQKLKTFDVCVNNKIDGGITIWPEIFLFNGTDVLRINYKTKVKELWKINELWAGGPDSIDSVYIRRMDYTIIMFYGKLYWEFKQFDLKENFPRPISDFGFSEKVTTIKAAINWYNLFTISKWTTFFIGEDFYNYNEVKKKLFKGNPKKQKFWSKKFSNVYAAIDHPKNKKRALLFISDLTTDSVAEVFLRHPEKTKVRPLTRFFLCN